MLRQAENLGQSSGIDVRCDVPCRILEGPHWKLVLENVTGSILFIDEENTFINTEEFASAARGSDNYFVLITRENLYNLPYSAEEIYGLHSSGKYQNTRKVYQEMYRIYANNPWLPIDPEKVITEDSNSGYTFFQAICRGKRDSLRKRGRQIQYFYPAAAYRSGKNLVSLLTAPRLARR